MCVYHANQIYFHSLINQTRMSLINFDFINFRFSSNTNNFQSFFAKCNSIENPFNDSDQPASIDPKYHDINNFNKFNINKNPSLATLHLNIASLSKYFEDLQNFLFLSKHSFDITGISKHKNN